MLRLLGMVSVMALGTAAMVAQPVTGDAESFGGPQPPPMRGAGGHRPPMDRGRPPGPQGRWWSDPSVVQRLALTADQQRRIDTIFQQSRLKLIELSAALEKEQTILEPLLESDNPDESTVVAQIDRIAQSRGELEKANARMLLSVRRVLSQDQWKRLQSEPPHGPPPGDRR